MYLHVASVLTSTQNTHLKPVPASMFPNRTFDSVCFPSIARSPRFFFVSAFPRAGFITRDDEQGDVFVHQSDIYAEGFRSLRNQEPVEFGLEPIGDGRFKATNVRAFPKAGASLSFSPPHRARRYLSPTKKLRTDFSCKKNVSIIITHQVTGPAGAFVQGALPRNQHKTRSPFMRQQQHMMPGQQGMMGGMPGGGVPFYGLTQPPFPMGMGMPPGMGGMAMGMGYPHMVPHMGMPGGNMGINPKSPGGLAAGMMPMPNPPMGGEYGPGGGRRVVVLNVPWHTSWEALKNLFASAGTVARADVALDEQGRSRGYGTVQFSHEHEATEAIKTLNGVDFEGRILTVRMDKYQE